MPADEKLTKKNLRPPPPRSDAVAVAVAQKEANDLPPRVIAGGHGRVAEQILDIAFKNGIKVREDADLAELLSAIDIDAHIPLEAFSTVAEILVYVYQASEKEKQEENRDSPPSNINRLAAIMADKWRQNKADDQ